ncbi:RNA polymerase sigma factor [Gemmatimonadota bacterium]
MSSKSGRPTIEPADVAIPRLLEEHGARIFAMGLHMCDTAQDAEDMVQETFVRAYRGWDRFEGRSQPSTWLYTIASRVAKRQYRRRAGEPRRLESMYRVLPSGEEGVVDLPVLGESSLEQVEREEVEERVQMVAGLLPLRFRLPLVLKDLADFSIAEIAQILELKENTVKTRIYRARMAMRKELVEGLQKRADLKLDHSKRICLDLLYAKQEALDRGVPFPLPQDQFCARCHAVFATLDLTQDVFRQLHHGAVPDAVRVALKCEMEADDSRSSA